jgi:hypothetical protein
MATQTGKVMVKAVDDWAPEQMQLLGRIVVAFSMIEQGLHNTPKRMRREKWDVYAAWNRDFTAQDRLIQARVEGAKLLPPDDFNRLSDLLDRVETVKTERNRLLHALWGKVKGTGDRVALKKGKRLDISVASLTAVLKDLQDVGAELNRTWKKWPTPDAATLAKVKANPTKWDFKKKAKKKP